MKMIRRTLASVLAVMMLVTSCPAFGTALDDVVETDQSLTFEEVAAAPVEEAVEEAETALVDAIVEESEEGLIPVPEDEVSEEIEDPAEEETLVEEARFSEGYIWVAELTDVFADAESETLLGIFPETAIAYALSRAEYEDAAEDMLEIMFAADGEAVTGYISADAILTMTEEEIEAYKANIQGNVAVIVKDDVVLANTPFELDDEEPTEVEQPEEMPAEEEPSVEEGASDKAEVPADGVIAAPQIYLSLASDEGVFAINETGSVTGINISAAATVREETTLQMNAAVTPEDANIGTVYWKSSNNSVATVNNDGVVTTKSVDKPTKVIITAYAADGSGTEARFELTVTPIVEANKVVISGVTNEVAVKKSIKLYADVLAGEEAASIQNVTWKIKSGTKYASIKTNSDGSATITGKKAGKLTVIATAKDGSKVVSEPFTVVVKSKAASSVKVASVNGITALDARATGKTLALKATVSSSSASQKVTWSVDAKYEDIASVSDKGVLSIKDGAFGEVIVKATALDGSKKSGTLTINIINPVARIEVTGDTAEVGYKKSITLTANAFAAEGEPTIPEVAWKTSNSKIASVKANADGTAKVTGVKKGTATITATAKDGSAVYGTYAVTVMPKAASSVKISSATAPFINIDAENKTLKLTAAVSPSTASQKYEWSVEDKYHGIANISKDGVLTAIGNEMGEVVVKATALDGSGKSATLTVYVGKSVANISITGMNAVKLKKSITLKAGLTAADGSATVSGVTWKIKSGSKYASMKANADGTVTITGKKAGKVTIIATANDGSIVTEEGTPATATFQITVKKSVSTLSIKGAKNIDLSKVPVDEEGNVVMGEECSFVLTAGEGAFTWTSSNPELFAVDADGLVYLKAKKPGSAVITAVNEAGKMGSVTVKALYNVTDIELTGTLVSADGVMHIVKGASAKIGASVLPNTAANSALTWKTSNKKVATVSSSGTVKGVKAGTVTITATAKDGSGVKETIKVTVHDAPTSVALYKNGASIKSGSVVYMYKAGQTINLTATVKPAKAYQSVEWSTNNATVATVENGVVTIVGNGTAKITAKTVDGKNKSAYIYLKVGTPVSEVVISGERSITIGKSTTLTAEVLPEEAINKAISWKVAPGYEAFASVSSEGVVKGKKSGYAKIIATADSGASDEFMVYVAPKSTKVFIYNGETDITGKTTEMYRNLGDGTLQLSARLNPTTADQSVTWKSSSTKIATVDKNGVVTAKKNGTVTITATAADGSKKKATAKLKITTVSLKVDVISENGVTELTAGASTQLKAVITPEGQSGLSVVWTSSDEKIATVDANGLVTAAAGVTGNVTITATVNGIPSEPYALAVTLRPETVAIQQPQSTTIDLNSDVKTIQLTAKVTPAGASQNIVWRSADESIATVDKNTGLVTAIKSGEVKIIATHADDASLAAEIAIRVVKLPNALDLKIDQTRLYAGESFKISATLSPAEVDNSKLNWKSSNEALVTVSADGTVTVSSTADKATEVTITAETEEALDDIKASIKLTVSSVGAVFTTADDGKTITKYIGDEKVVRIPTGVTKIADGAFDEKGANVTGLVMHDNLTVESGALTGLAGLADADGFLVLDGRLITYTGKASAVTVPANVTRIDDGAFEGNTSITSVKLPNSITVIGKRAFAGCTNLSEMTCYN